MAVATTSTFTGFRPEAVEFLAELAANNDRAWFQPRKAEYERLLKAPLEALCVALDEQFVLLLPSEEGEVAVLCGVAYWQPLGENLFAVGAKFHRVLRQGSAAPAGPLAA